MSDKYFSIKAAVYGNSADVFVYDSIGKPDGIIRAIRDAIDTAQGFKRKVLVDLDERLRQLRDGLPELVMEEVK
jgi:hypothetical protein